MIKKDYRIVSAFDAISYTEVPRSLRSLLKQRTRWYRGFIQNLRKHSDMIFNRKYPHLGCFVLPIASFLAIFIGSALTVSLIFTSIRNIMIFLKDIFYIPIIEKMAVDIGNISFASLIIEPYSAITYSSILIGSLIVLIVSFRTLNVSFKKKLIFLPVYLFIYYSLIMIFWIISALMELVGWKREW
jgi:cellulose synthase/poly-beta-1,6-N-acetylglucosamine synthase-like glycosyltransferase